jgi:hypothetical protein
MNQEFEFKLQAWLDGELSPSEAHSIGREIAGDAEASRLVTELQAIKSALAGNEVAVAVPETREFYWSKIARQIEREAAAARPNPAPRIPAWRHWLSPLAGLAGLACMVILAAHPEGAPAFDEISSTGEGMEAVTFHDQSAGITVVWLADTSTSQLSPEVKDASTPAPDAAGVGNSEVEME